MTLSEFKAWFDGYTEGMDSTPNAKQWDRIKGRVKEIDNTVTTYPVYVDRWRPYYREWTPYYGAIGLSTTGVSLSAGTSTTSTVAGALGATSDTFTVAYNEASFDPLAAMNGIGRADALVDAA